MVPDPYSRKAIDDILSDEEFWVEMGYVFHSRINSVSRRVIQESLRAAQASGTIFDFDSIHPEALRQTLNTSSIWWSRMEETTRNALRIALISWQLGDIRGWGELLDTLEPLFGRDRAKRIATTEVTRIFGLGEVFASESDPMVGGEIWMTAQDEKVCSICGPRHGRIYPKGSLPILPAHVFCRCAWAPATWGYIIENPSLWQGDRGAIISQAELNSLVGV